MSKGQRSGDSGSSGRGFASMDSKQQREISSKGRKTVHEKGTTHVSHQETVAAGRKGAQARSGNTSSGKSEDRRKGGNR